MWKKTKEGWINFAHVRRIRIQKAHWVYNRKDFHYALIAEGHDFSWDFEFFDTEDDAQAYIDNLISELNNYDKD